MGTLEATAQAFCQECLGWDDARAVNDCGCIYVRRESARSWKALPHTRADFFFAQQVDAVIEKAQGWCEKAEAVLEMEWSKARGWHIEITHGNGVASEDSSNLGWALLAACVQAQRELMEGAGERGRVAE